MINFLVETLFFTNTWIYLYIFILQNLRLIFTPKPNDNFLILGVMPEPFEISLYLLLTFLAVAVIFIFQRQIKNAILTIPTLAKYIVFIILGLLFLRNLGNYPLKGELFSYPIKQSYFLNHSLLIFFLAFIAIDIILIEAMLLREFFENKPFRKLLLYISILTVIFIVTFPGRFPISGVDYSYFLGPLWEIVHGKTLYTQSPSQYGFLSILIFAVLYKLRFISFSHLPILIWILFVAQYFLCFYLIYKQSRSSVFAIVGLFSILVVNFLTVRVVPTDYPQSGPLRWFPLVFSVFALLKLKNLTSTLLITSIGILSFWQVDTGIELLTTYIFTLFLFFINGELRVRKMLQALTTLACTIVAFFIFINTSHLAFGYKTIDIINIFSKLRQYAQAGFGMLPIESKNFFWIEILFYFAIIIYFFNQKKNNNVLIFCANLSLFASIYYVGRSHPAELYTIALFISLSIFIFLGHFYDRLSNVKYRIFSIIIICIIFIFIPLFLRKESFAQAIELKIYRLKKGNVFKPEMEEILQNKYSKEVKMVKDMIPYGKIIIISGDDTYLLYLTGKEDLLDDNPIVNILTKKDLESATENAVKICPKRIVTECRLFNNCGQTELFSKAFYVWQPIILAEIQNRCRLQYKPIRCTDQLCIVEAQ